MLWEGDLTVGELGAALGIRGNLLAHHLNVLEDAGVISRLVSEGDRRLRYATLHREKLDWLTAAPRLPGGIVFVCSHNSARSQFAAAYWKRRTGLVASSAGSAPAARVHPTAVRVAAERGLDIARAQPRSYGSLPRSPELLISVCDRAREGDLPYAQRKIHWSIPDPVLRGRVDAFRSAFDDIERRIDRLAP
jgi:protein-tyrosine-phosphatase